jgi:outer membrane protein assembly factor BamB
MVIGYDDIETLDRELMNDIAFACSDRYGSNKASYYREHLLKERSDDVEPEEVMMPVESPPTTVLSSGPMDSPWPMKCYDSRHTGQSPFSTSDNQGIEKWRFITEIDILGSIVIDGEGIIYFGSGNNLHALFPDGSLKWVFNTNSLIWSSPAIADDGTIYIGDYDGNLFALNPNGTLKWQFDTIGNGNSISSSPVIGKNGTIYFGTMGYSNMYHRVYSIYPNGSEKWHYETGDFITSDPAIGDDGTIYIGSADKYLYAMNPNGTLKWRYKTGGWVKAHPSIADDGTIYFGSFDGYLYALYPNGTLKWRQNGMGSMCETATIAMDGTIYFDGGDLFALYPNGTLKWQFDFGENRFARSSPAISAEGTIYIGVTIGEYSGGELIVVNPDGTEKWRKRIAYNAEMISSPVIAEDGTVYIGSGYTSSKGCFHAFGNQKSNIAPSTPNITGETNGSVREEYKYSFSSVDPDNNPVSFYIEWGDDSTSEWSRDYASCETASIKHTWNKKGTYIIKVKAKDTFGEESNWGYLEVIMPKNKIINPFERFLENHPYMFPLLRQLMELQ